MGWRGGVAGEIDDGTAHLLIHGPAERDDLVLAGLPGRRARSPGDTEIILSTAPPEGATVALAATPIRRYSSVQFLLEHCVIDRKVRQ
jgi:hypothetical protein